MNIYKELLDRFCEVKGDDIERNTKDYDLKSLLKHLYICKEIKDAYTIDLTSKLFINLNVSSVNAFNSRVNMRGGDGYIGLFSEIYNSDKQPNDEQMLLKISHSTGAYMFGDYYPRDFFDKFFQEVQERTNVEYVDIVNRSLYYTLENVMETLQLYKEIYEEYVEKNKENYRLEMIKRKKAELEKLEAEL